MSWPHTPPDEGYIEQNELYEPEGERIRKELIEFLERNKIVGILLDTASHTVEVNIGMLPPKLKTVLSKYGAISVVDSTPDWEAGDALPAHHALRNGRPEYVYPTRPEGWDDNIVPPMTHPLSRHWDQPFLTDIKIDSKKAVMPLHAFYRLSEYSTSVPSAVYGGKMWKARVYKDYDETSQAGKEQWELRWYGYSKIGAGYCSNHSRLIEISSLETAND